MNRNQHNFQPCATACDSLPYSSSRSIPFGIFFFFRKRSILQISNDFTSPFFLSTRRRCPPRNSLSSASYKRIPSLFSLSNPSSMSSSYKRKELRLRNFCSFFLVQRVASFVVLHVWRTPATSSLLQYHVGSLSTSAPPVLASTFGSPLFRSGHIFARDVVP